MATRGSGSVGRTSAGAATGAGLGTGADRGISNGRGAADGTAATNGGWTESAPNTYAGNWSGNGDSSYDSNWSSNGDWNSGYNSNCNWNNNGNWNGNCNWNPCWSPCWNPCGWSSWGGGWSVGVGFGGGGWGFGFGYSGGGWGVSVGFSNGYWGGGGGYGCGSYWNPAGYGWCSPWWPSYCSTWYAPWYVGTVYYPSPIVYEYPPIYYPVITSPMVIEEPIVYTPQLEWPGYAALGGESAPATLASTVPASPVPQLTAMVPAGVLEQDAWDSLAIGQDFRAEELFAQVLNQEPENPRARAGYGLAAALSGREATAVWAIRDALALRPDVLDALPLPQGVRSRLTELARSFEQSGAELRPLDSARMDALFLAAAIRASVGDRAQAAYAMDVLARQAELDPTRERFRERLAAQLAGGY